MLRGCVIYGFRISEVNDKVLELKLTRHRAESVMWLGVHREIHLTRTERHRLVCGTRC